MPEAVKRTSAEEAEENGKTAPPDAAAERDIGARIRKARAQVNLLLAAQERPLLHDGPPGNAARADEAKELQALEFLETGANPHAYRYVGAENALSLMASMTRAGLKMVAEARGEPEPDFGAEYAEGHGKGSASSSAPAAGPETKAARIRAFDESQWTLAEENGGLVPLTEDRQPLGGWRQPRLPDPAVSPHGHWSKAVPPVCVGADETEAQLNGLIADCRLLLREVAFHSARLACEAGDRVRFLEAGCRIAETGAKVGRTVARLRGGTAVVAEHRQRMVVEHVHTERRPASALGGEGGT